MAHDSRSKRSSQPHATSGVALLALPAVSSNSGQVMHHPRHSPPLAWCVAAVHGFAVSSCSLIAKCQFPVSSKNFPVPLRREIGHKTLIYMSERQGYAPVGCQNSQEFPVFSRLSGNLPLETRSPRSPSTATLNTCYSTILYLSGIGRIRGRILRFFRGLRFGSRWQRQYPLL